MGSGENPMEQSKEPRVHRDIDIRTYDIAVARTKTWRVTRLLRVGWEGSKSEEHLSCFIPQKSLHTKVSQQEKKKH